MISRWTIAYCSAKNPQYRAFPAMESIYGKRDNMMIALVPEDGHVFTQKTRSIIAEMTERAWQTPYSIVDIVNQTDAVEALDGEEKLGQPMIKLSIPQNWGLVDLFVLPYFRERTFAGEEGRLRFGLPIDTDRTVYDSSAEEQHVDGALRYIHSVGEWEVGLSYFSGTSRDPHGLSRSSRAPSRPCHRCFSDSPGFYPSRHLRRKS